MSTQRSKKKRLGSHRRVANQNETPKVDELHVTDSISVAQRQIPEENESLSVLPNTDSLQRETQHPPSPDLTLNRRKLGSRRKNKGQHVKDSATELYHEPGEEVEENTKGTEAQSERQEELGNVSVQDMSATHDSSLYSAITPGYSCEVQNPAATNCSDDVLEILISQGRNQKADQDENETDCEVKSYSCKRVETMLEVTDKSGMPQSKEVTENVVGGSDSTSLSVPSCPTVDQQLIAQSDSREMPEEHLSVYCAKEKENRERDKDTDLSRQDGNLQGNYLISESHVESVVPGFSTTAEITIDKNSPRQDTGLECGVEQATFSLPTEELPADENQNEQFSLPLNSQARDTSVWIEEQTDTNFNPTLNRRKLGSSRRNKGRQHVKNSIGESYYETKEDIVENGSNEAFETTEMSSLIDTAVHATSLETMLEGMDKSDTSGQSSTLHPSPSDDQRLIDQSNDREMPREEVPSVDSVTDTERTEREEDTDLLRQWGILQSHVISDHVNVNQPTEIQKNHLIDYSSGSVINDATENSEIHFANLTDQAGVSDTYQTVAESYQKPQEEGVEDVEDITGNKALQITSVALQSSQEDRQHDIIMSVTHDDSLNTESTSDYSSEVQNPATTTYPEADLESLMTENENLQEIHDERETGFKVELSDKSLEATLEGLDRADTLQSEEANDTHSEDNVTEVHEQDVKPTQIQKMHESDYTFESVVHDTAEYSDTCSGNLRDQDEVSDTYQSELLVESIDDPAPMQELSDPDDKQDEPPTKECNVEALDQIDEDDHVYDTKKPQTSDRERIDTALDQVYDREGQAEDDIKPSAEQTGHQEKEGLLSDMEESESSLQTLQSETNAPSDSQPLDNPLKTDEQNDADFNPIRNRRKLGSSRRNKGRQHVKGSGAESYHKPTEDVVRNTTDNEPLETTKMSLTIETAVQEISIETMLEGKETFNLSQTLGVAQATISSPKEELSTNEEQNEHFSLSEVRGAQHSEDAVHEEEEVKLTEMQKMHQFDYSSIKESKPSLESLQSEIWSPLESQPMDNSQSIKEETHSGFKTTRNRRKLGSSRRNKGRQHVPESVTEPYPEEEVVENTWRNEASETEEIPSGTGTMWQEELKEHTYSSTIETTDIALRSDKNDFLKSIEEVSEEEKKHIKEPENLTPLTGYDTVKIDLIQSEEASTERTTDVQGPVQVEEREEYEDPANKDRAAQEIDIPNVVTHAELLSAAQNKTDTWDPFDIGHEENQSANPAMDVSEESGISTAGDACNSQQDIQEKDKSLVDNSESLQGKVKQKKRKMGSTRRTQLNRKQEGETDNKDETIERNLDMEVDVRKLDRMEVVEELPLIPTTEEKENTQPSLGTVYKEQLETNETSSVHDKRHLQQSSDLQTVESNVKPGTEDLMVLPPGQSASYNEEVVNPVAFLHGAYVRDSEGNVDVSVEPPQQDDFTSTEMQTASVVAGRNRRSIDQLLSSNTEGAMNTDSDITLYSSETAQSTQNDQALKLTEVPSVAVADLEKVKSVVRGEAEEEHENAQASAQEQNYVNEGAHNTSPHFSSTNRRRKLGSTRRNLGSRSKGEDLHQKQEVDNEATAINVGDVLTEGVSGIDEKELQIHNEHKDGDSAQRKEKVFETVEYRHTGESQVKPIAHQAVEENPDFLSQLEETEHQLTPDHLPATPSTSPKHDGGRRRKMGSHRKSRGHQHFEDQTEREGRIIDAQKVRDESATKTAEGHTEESSGLDIISEVDECNQKSSSSISKATEHTRPKSEKAPKWVNPVQYPQAEIRLGQDSQKLSFAGADIRSKSYDVLMVGDSSVGKTSFMKRAQSGKFSLDLPASVGLDSCMWTVVVDGKPVVLQLWDTAGQERFHSITRQVFHKAQAFLLMYDITSSQSFTAVSYWANCIQEGAVEDVTILLLGNKSDHAKRQVKTQEGEILAKEYNFQFMECSAATGENVIQSLETVARMLRQKVDTTEEAVVLHQEPPQKKRSGCC